MAADGDLIFKIALLVVVLLIIWIFWDVLVSRPYKRYSAWIIGIVSAAVEPGLKREKARIFQLVKEYQKQVNRDITILEIGSGAAVNLAYFPQNSQYVCLDPNQYFNEYAKETIKKHDNVVSTKIVQGYAEDMPFDNETFDVVVCTLVLCSVKSIQKCLEETKRVLKPGGKFVFVEHVAYEDKSTWRYFVQVVMNPVHQIFFDGCSANRDTGVYIKAAGFSDVNLVTFFPMTLPFWLRPCVAGAATK